MMQRKKYVQHGLYCMIYANSVQIRLTRNKSSSQ